MKGNGREKGAESAGEEHATKPSSQKTDEVDSMQKRGLK